MPYFAEIREWVWRMVKIDEDGRVSPLSRPGDPVIRRLLIKCIDFSQHQHQHLTKFLRMQQHKDIFAGVWDLQIIELFPGVCNILLCVL